MQNTIHNNAEEKSMQSERKKKEKINNLRVPLPNQEMVQAFLSRIFIFSCKHIYQGT